MNIKIGHGYDVHRLVKERSLILGGVKIDYDYGLDGHSDADVLCHAISDALLGAAGKKDIGQYFPDHDETYCGISSLLLLEKVKAIIEEDEYRIGNIDATIIAQAPKLAPHIDKMRENIANALKIDKENVNIKATTEEKLGFTGRMEGISAHAVCLIFRS